MFPEKQIIMEFINQLSEYATMYFQNKINEDQPKTFIPYISQSCAQK